MEIYLMSSNQVESILLEKLYESWKFFVSNLPLGFSAETAIPDLYEYGNNRFFTFKEFASNLIKPIKFRQVVEFENGMNSPGILWDRLTILNCKLLFTAPESVHHKPLIHKSLGNVKLELKSVLEALNHSLPARHILLAKEATVRQKIITPLEDSLWALQLSNIAMWINQDLLYTVSADEVELQRLRDYINFFSKANRIRNTAIENIEIFYIQQLKGNLS
jgi:hypothetical protein